jgi:predicted RNA-binding Zn-ribbon protein involved in translation (DUF1610 family)
MPTLVTCTSCGKKLKLPETLTATKVRCPGCAEIISVTKSAITAKRPPTQPNGDEEPRRKREIEGIQKDLPSDTRPRSRPDTEEISEVERDDEEARPRKKKRKRRSKAKKSADGVPWWVWAGLAGTFLVFAGVISAALIHAGYGKQLLIFMVGMAIILPVSVVILVLSMFIASALLGGVDFGQAHIAIPKAAALLFVVNLISMIPFIGPLLALPVWWLGLMGLFSLDFVETRTLVIINWGLNTIFKYFVLAAILTVILHHGGSAGPRNIKVPSREAAAVKKIEALGGSCDADDDDDDGGHIAAVSLENKPIDKETLTLLHSFPKLTGLDLEQTQMTDQGLSEVATLSTLEHLDLAGNPGVTDAGLDQLAALPKLQVLVLTGTSVTEAGVQKLRAARPGLHVIR